MYKLQSQRLVDSNRVEAVGSRELILSVKRARSWMTYDALHHTGIQEMMKGIYLF